MKLTDLPVILIAALTCITPYIPVYAETSDQGTKHSEDQTQSVQPAPSAELPPASRKIPESTAIAIAFPSDLIINANTEQITTLSLAEPIFDDAGNEVAPKNSLISVRLKPGKKGMTLEADFLVVRGKTIPIQASNIFIPGETVTLQSGIDQAREASLLGQTVAGTVIGATNVNNVDAIKQGALAGNGLGIVVGLLSPKKATVVKIPQGRVYILTLQSAAYLP